MKKNNVSSQKKAVWRKKDKYIAVILSIIGIIGLAIIGFVVKQFLIALQQESTNIIMCVILTFLYVFSLCYPQVKLAQKKEKQLTEIFSKDDYKRADLENFEFIPMMSHIVTILKTITSMIPIIFFNLMLAEVLKSMPDRQKAIEYSEFGYIYLIFMVITMVVASVFLIGLCKVGTVTILMDIKFFRNRQINYLEETFLRNKLVKNNEEKVNMNIEGDSE